MRVCFLGPCEKVGLGEFSRERGKMRNGAATQLEDMNGHEERKVGMERFVMALRRDLITEGRGESTRAERSLEIGNVNSSAVQRMRLARAAGIGPETGIMAKRDDCWRTSTRSQEVWLRG